MSETTPLIKAALNLRVGVGFDVYGQTVAKTVMVYSRQVIMTDPLILKMQSMLMRTEANGMFTGIIYRDITLRMKMESDRKENIYLMKLNTFIITNNSEIP